MPDLVDLNTKTFYIYDSKKDNDLNNAMGISGVNNNNYKNKITSPPTFNNDGKSGNKTYSFISTINPLTNRSENYVQSGPFTVFDLNVELSDRMNEYMRALSEFQRCQRISQYINFGSAQGLTATEDDSYYFDSTKSPNFANDPGACHLFGNTMQINTSVNRSSNGGASIIYGNLTSLNGNVFSTNNNSIYTSASSDINAFPAFASTLAVAQLSITGQYGVTEKDKPATQGKNLAQMTGDITNLLQNYQKIVGYYTSSIPASGSTYDNNKSNYDINKLKQTFESNLQLRQELDQKVQAVLGAKGSYAYDSKMNVDASIYANIMLSILATTLIYFVLVKL